MNYKNLTYADKISILQTNPQWMTILLKYKFIRERINSYFSYINRKCRQFHQKLKIIIQFFSLPSHLPKPNDIINNLMTSYLIWNNTANIIMSHLVSWLIIDSGDLDLSPSHHGNTVSVSHIFLFGDCIRNNFHVMVKDKVLWQTDRQIDKQTYLKQYALLTYRSENIKLNVEIPECI
jgi:hypothetical protein